MKDCKISWYLLQPCEEQLQLCWYSFRREGLMTNTGSTSIVSPFLSIHGHTADVFHMAIRGKVWGLGRSFCLEFVWCPALEPSCMGGAARPHNNAVYSDNHRIRMIQAGKDL